MITSIDTINDICINVIIDIYRNINNNNNWINLDMIILSCLQRLQIPCLEALGLSISSITSLSLLVSIHNDIETYIRTYINIKSIITLCDLENDLINFLKSKCYPSILSISSLLSASLNIINKDPNEINLDTDVQISRKPRLDNSIQYNSIQYNRNIVINCFEDYGLGKLCTHPIIIQLFQLHMKQINDDYNCCRCYSIKNDIKLLDTNNIIQYLVDFVRDNNNHDDNNDNEDDNFTNRFILFLNHQLAPLSISDYWVIIYNK